jgi:hypothetical protein
MNQAGETLKEKEFRRKMEIWSKEVTSGDTKSRIENSRVLGKSYYC